MEVITITYLVMYTVFYAWTMISSVAHWIAWLFRLRTYILNCELCCRYLFPQLRQCTNAMLPYIWFYIFPMYRVKISYFLITNRMKEKYKKKLYFLEISTLFMAFIDNHISSSQCIMCLLAVASFYWYSKSFFVRRLSVSSLLTTMIWWEN